MALWTNVADIGLMLGGAVVAGTLAALWAVNLRAGRGRKTAAVDLGNGDRAE